MQHNWFSGWLKPHKRIIIRAIWTLTAYSFYNSKFNFDILMTAPQWDLWYFFKLVCFKEILLTEIIILTSLIDWIKRWKGETWVGFPNFWVVSKITLSQVLKLFN
jgi:hypothetical protein